MGSRISVVMACYSKDRLTPIKHAVESIFNQSISFYEFIVVIDGPVDKSINNYFDNLAKRESAVKLLRLAQNRGAAYARNYAMSKSKGDYIAIMDADDISTSNRFARQLEAIENYKVDAVWGWQEEFYDETNTFAGVKRSAERHDRIVQELKFRCLLPDPTTFVRRECYERTGGYGAFSDINIDYQFFVKIVLAGFKLYCVPDVLIKVRVSSEQRKRRGGMRLLKQDIAFRNWMKNIGFINLRQYIKAIIAIALFRLVPSKVRDFIYTRVLRSPN